jgi:hypothetical protein
VPRHPIALCNDDGWGNLKMGERGVLAHQGRFDLVQRAAVRISKFPA